jgi:hypothetical protein
MPVRNTALHRDEYGGRTQQTDEESTYGRQPAIVTHSATPGSTDFTLTAATRRQLLKTSTEISGKFASIPA